MWSTSFYWINLIHLSLNQILSGTRLHANRALAPDRQRQLNARAAEDVAARRGPSGVTGEQLEADWALRLEFIGMLRAHVLLQGARLPKRRGAVRTAVVPALLVHRAHMLPQITRRLELSLIHI